MKWVSRYTSITVLSPECCYEVLSLWSLVQRCLFSFLLENIIKTSSCSFVSYFQKLENLHLIMYGKEISRKERADIAFLLNITQEEHEEPKALRPIQLKVFQLCFCVNTDNGNKKTVKFGSKTNIKVVLWRKKINL